MIALDVLVGLLLLAFSAGQEPAATPSVPSKPARPLHIMTVGKYLDGGTESFEVRDSKGVTIAGGCDGRMSTAMPKQWFAGAQHPEQGARLLPLWGAEERALVQLALAAFEDALAESTRAHLAGIPRGGALGTVPESLLREWTLYHMAHDRWLLEQAVDSGRVEAVEHVAAWIQATPPFSLREIEVSEPADSIRVLVGDAADMKLEVSFRGYMHGAPYHWIEFRDPGRGIVLSLTSSRYEERYALALAGAAVEDVSRLSDAGSRSEDVARLRALLRERSAALIREDRER